MRELMLSCGWHIVCECCSVIEEMCQENKLDTKIYIILYVCLCVCVVLSCERLLLRLNVAGCRVSVCECECPRHLRAAERTVEVKTYRWARTNDSITWLYSTIWYGYDYMAPNMRLDCCNVYDSVCECVFVYRKCEDFG